MRHRLRGRKLGRNGTHREALLRNLMRCFIVEAAQGRGFIETTLAKAKEVRPDLEKLITVALSARIVKEQAKTLRAGAGSSSDEYRNWLASQVGQDWLTLQSRYLHFQRRLFAVVRSRELVNLLVDVVSAKFVGRAGGYTRVVKLAKQRLADGAHMAYLEPVNEPVALRME